MKDVKDGLKQDEMDNEVSILFVIDTKESGPWNEQLTLKTFLYIQPRKV